MARGVVAHKSIERKGVADPEHFAVLKQLKIREIERHTVDSEKLAVRIEVKQIIAKKQCVINLIHPQHQFRVLTATVFVGARVKIGGGNVQTAFFRLKTSRKKSNQEKAGNKWQGVHDH